METEERNEEIERLLKQCNFIGSARVKVTDKIVEAIKEARVKADKWDKAMIEE
jgi:hypothetical protein